MATILRIMWASALAVCVGGSASAQDAASKFPDRPVRWIVDANPGGSSDLYARIIGKHLTEAWGQPVVVENRPGATGAIAFGLAARAAPDGYTLVSVTNTLTLGLAYKKSLPYTLKSFAPVSLFFTAPNALVVSASSPVRSFQELVTLAKSKADGLAYGTPGIGSASHLSAELLARKLGFTGVHVPFGGGAPVVGELLAGRLDFAFVNIPNASPSIQDGKLRILAVSGKNRLPAYPDIPTVGEFVEGFNVITWFGVATTAGVPDPVLKKLNGEINKSLQTPEMRQRIQAAGAEPQVLSVQEFQAFLEQDMALWGRILKEAQIDLKD